MFELDVYWTVMGQQDPVEWMENYPNRFKLLHIKDRWIIGDSGMMNFPNIFKKRTRSVSSATTWNWKVTKKAVPSSRA